MVSFNLRIVLFGAKTEAKYCDATPLNVTKMRFLLKLIDIGGFMTPSHTLGSVYGDNERSS